MRIVTQLVLLMALQQVQIIAIVVMEQLTYIDSIRIIEVSLPHSLKLLGFKFHEKSFHNISQLNCFF